MTKDIRTQLIDKSTYRGERETESFVHSPLFGREIPVIIRHNPGANDISDEQIQAIAAFLKIKRGMDKIKTELFRHWETVDNWGDFEFATPDDAFASAELEYLRVPPSQKFGDDVCLLCFAVKWDVEHGAAILVRNGVIGEFAND